jgi:hypothetical protein
LALVSSDALSVNAYSNAAIADIFVAAFKVTVLQGARQWQTMREKCTARLSRSLLTGHTIITHHICLLPSANR